MAQDLHIGHIPEFDELKEYINSFSFLEDKQFDESESELILQKAAEGDMQGTLSLLESLDFGAPSVECINSFESMLDIEATINEITRNY